MTYSTRCSARIIIVALMCAGLTACFKPPPQPAVVPPDDEGNCPPGTHKENWTLPDEEPCPDSCVPDAPDGWSWVRSVNGCEITIVGACTEFPIYHCEYY